MTFDNQTIRTSNGSLLVRWCCIVYIIQSIVIVTCFVKQQTKLPKNYQSLSAYDKQTKLWNIIKSKQGTQSRYPNAIEGLITLTESFEPTVKHYGDNIPYYHKKRIHSVGAVVTTKLVITNTDTNPFTGIFQTGSQYGISRLSLAASVNDNQFVPGIAVKFLRSNNKPSANFVAMLSLEGQKGGNFFQNEFSNHIPDLPDGASIFLQLGAASFRRVSNDPFKVGLSDICSYNEDGIPITPASTINFPYKIILVPNPTLTTLFDNVSNEQQLKSTFTTKIQSNTTLYQIYGTVSPTNNTDRILIGELITTSQPIYSQLGDEFLFFRHQLMEDDIKLRPEWKQQQKQKKQRKNIRQRTRNLQDMFTDMIEQNTQLASIHSNISSIQDRFVSPCAFANHLQ